jgi:hypothetical protein
MLRVDMHDVFTEDELFKQQVDAVSRFMSVKTQHGVETCIEFARYLNKIGLTSDNYPLFLEFLRDENHHVVNALLGEEPAFDYFTRVQPNRYIINFCFEVLGRHKPGGVHDRTLELIFGILFRNYHSAKEGYALYPIREEHLNSIGKYLDKQKNQNDAINRFILDILGDISNYTSLNFEDESVDKIAAHAVDIRNAYFDRRVGMETAIPQELLLRIDFRARAIDPRTTQQYRG